MAAEPPQLRDLLRSRGCSRQMPEFDPAVAPDNPGGRLFLRWLEVAIRDGVRRRTHDLGRRRRSGATLVARADLPGRRPRRPLVLSLPARPAARAATWPPTRTPPLSFCWPQHGPPVPASAGPGPSPAGAPRPARPTSWPGRPRSRAGGARRPPVPSRSATRPNSTRPSRRPSARESSADPRLRRPRLDPVRADRRRGRVLARISAVRRSRGARSTQAWASAGSEA